MGCAVNCYLFRSWNLDTPDLRAPARLSRLDAEGRYVKTLKQMPKHPVVQIVAAISDKNPNPIWAGFPTVTRQVFRQGKGLAACLL